MIIENLAHVDGCECRYEEDGEVVDILCLPEDERESLRNGFRDVEKARFFRMPLRKKT